MTSFLSTDPMFIGSEYNEVTHPADLKCKPAKHILAIDSRQRDFIKFPHPNCYSIDIPNYNNVTGIELKAAMLPRTEYNVNSCNKYIDMVLGDFIRSIKTKDIKTQIFHNQTGKLYHQGSPGKFELEISPTVLKEIPESGIVRRTAKIYALIDENSILQDVYIDDCGAGYSSQTPPEICLKHSNCKFDITVGFHIRAELREGQYTIGGNPSFVVNPDTNLSFQSWVPTNLMCEIEAALSAAILTAEDYGAKKPVNYAYSRKAWNTYSKPTIDLDYPLFFSARIMSQYPTLESYTNFDPNTSSETSYATNSCRFNRIYLSNILCLRVNFDPNSSLSNASGVVLPAGELHEYAGLAGELYDAPDTTPGITARDHVVYKIKQSFQISKPSPPGEPATELDYLAFYEVHWGHHDNNSRGIYWSGPNVQLINSYLTLQNFFSSPSSYTPAKVSLAHWEILFASGENNMMNAASLLGFNKINYNSPTHLSNPIKVYHTFGHTLTKTNTNTLIPRGLTY